MNILETAGARLAKTEVAATDIAGAMTFVEKCFSEGRPLIKSYGDSFSVSVTNGIAECYATFAIESGNMGVAVDHRLWSVANASLYCNSPAELRKFTTSVRKNLPAAARSLGIVNHSLPANLKKAEAFISSVYLAGLDKVAAAWSTGRV